MADYLLDYANIVILIFCLYIPISICISTSLSCSLAYSFPILNSSNQVNTLFICLFLVNFLCVVELSDIISNINVYYNGIFIIFLFFTVLFIFITKEYLTNKRFVAFEYDITIVFSLLSMALVNISKDFLHLYLSIELQSFCFYVLACMKKSSEFSTEAGLKYFVLGTFISGFLLMALSFFFVAFGNLNMDVIKRVDFLLFDYLLGISTLIFITSFLFKLGAFPFHFWVCDVYDGSPLNITCFFSTIPKIVLLGFFLRFLCITSWETFDFVNYIIQFAALGSICLASTAALYQKRMKRLLAYSSISHVGFMLISIWCATVDSFKASFIYLIIYMTMIISVFCLALLFSLDNVQQKYIISWKQLTTINPYLANTFSITLLSIAGIPPLMGFYSKFCVLNCVIYSGAIKTSIAIILFSTVACFFYIRLVKMLLFNKEKNRNSLFCKTTNYIEFFISIFITLTVLLLLKPIHIQNCCSILAVCLL